MENVINEKALYEAPTVEIISFFAEDIVTASGGFDGEVDEEW